MSESAVALLVMAVLLPTAMWCSLRMAAVADLDILPSHCRRRIHWWQTHEVHVHLACAVLVVLVVAHQTVS